MLVPSSTLTCRGASGRLQATELYRLQNTQNVSNIDSESLTSFEVGLRGGNEHINYDLSAYVMRKDDFIFRDTTRTNVDNGETSHRGIEISFGALSH
ncbi:MAG: TonB-dependent receptor [Gammaproteobacteria bacterium]|nr:TonB-dependent receptor [Gammaproteobacteria bacterium]